MIEFDDPQYQSTGWDCGPACMATVLRYYGKPVPRSNWPTSPIDGTHPFSILPILNRSGLRVLAGSTPIESLTAHVRNLRPAICLVQYTSESHYVVVKGVFRGCVWYFCPVRGICKEKTEDFLSGWWSDGELPKQYHQWSALIWQ